MRLDDINKQITEINEQQQVLKSKMTDPLLCMGTAVTFSRISGYYRSIDNWNPGKQEEFRERSEYKVDNEKDYTNYTQGYKDNYIDYLESFNHFV